MTDLEISRTCAEALELDHEVTGAGLVYLYCADWKGYCQLYTPLTDPAQNMECLWWLTQRSDISLSDGEYLWCEWPDGGAQYSFGHPFTTREEFMRAVCEAVCAVKEAGNG